MLRWRRYMKPQRPQLGRRRPRTKPRQQMIRELERVGRDDPERMRRVLRAVLGPDRLRTLEKFQGPLAEHELRQMLASGPIHPATYRRAMGAAEAAPHYNPRGAQAMARKAHARDTRTGDLFGPRKGPAKAHHAKKKRARRPSHAASHQYAHAIGPMPHVTKSGRRRKHKAVWAWDTKTRRRVRVDARTGYRVGRHSSSYTKAPRRRKRAAPRRKSSGLYRDKGGRWHVKGGAFASKRQVAGRRGSGHKKHRKGRRGRSAARRSITLKPRAQLRVTLQPRRKGQTRRAFTVRNPEEAKIMATNPHHRRRRRRHNPGGIQGAARQVMAAALPAAAGGFAAGFMDAKVTGNLPLLARIAAKLAVAAAGGMFLRANPVRAAAFMGSMIGTASYEPGLKLGGGVLATSKPAGIKELAAMAAEDEHSLGLLQAELQGFGLLSEEMGGIDEEPNLGEEPSLGDEFQDLADAGWGDDADAA